MISHFDLGDYLGMDNLSVIWVPHLLTTEQKRNDLKTLKEWFDSNMFLRNFITVDETWTHHNIPKTKLCSNQYGSPSQMAPKEAKLSLSANKDMATVF